MCLDFSYFKEEQELDLVEKTEKELELLPNFFIKQRKNRDLIKNSSTIKKVVIGDVLKFIYFYRSKPLIFIGICIAIKKKSFMVPNMILVLRNLVLKTAIELTLLFFYNNGYSSTFLDYKRKLYSFNKNKLYFLRYRLNRESRVGAV
jgi:ribosomal protein L19